MWCNQECHSGGTCDAWYSCCAEKARCTEPTLFGVVMRSQASIPERSRPIGGDLHRITVLIRAGTLSPQTLSADLAPRPRDQGSQNICFQT